MGVLTEGFTDFYLQSSPPLVLEGAIVMQSTTLVESG